MIVHRIIFFAALLYAIWRFGGDAVYLLKVGQLWLEAFLSDPAGTLQYLFNGSAKQ